MIHILAIASLSVFAVQSAMAGDWSDSFQLFSSTAESIGRQGYDVPNSGGTSFVGDPEFSTFSTTETAAGGGWAAVTGATSIARNRLAMEVVAGALPDDWATSARGASTWTERITLMGGQGAGRAQYTAFLDFDYALQAEGFGPLLGSSLLVSLQWGIAQGGQTLASGVFSESYVGGGFNEATGQPACIDAQNGSIFIACSGNRSLGEVGEFEFVYGQPIELWAYLSVDLTGTVMFDAMNTGGFENIGVPDGVQAIYESGRSDNPLGIYALPIPELPTLPMFLAGIGALAWGRRTRRTGAGATY